MKILLVSFFNPLEPHSGAGLRSNCLLRNLIDLGCRIHLFAFSQSETFENFRETSGIEKSCFVTRTARLGPKTWLKSLLLFRPLAISQHLTNRIRNAFVRFTSGESYDAVIFDHLCAFELRRDLDNPPVKTIINEHNAEFIMAREFYRNQDKFDQKLILFIDSFLLKRYELFALRSADRVLHVSEEDLRHFGEEIRRKSVVIPNTLPYKKKFGTKDPPGNNVVFVGAMVHSANVDGITRFIREAWMDIHNLRSDINLWIVGADPPPEIREFHGKYNIHVLGFVDDLSALYAKTTIAIAPIYIGSGSRLKILEAMMNGTLTIASPKGAEGLPVEDRKHIVIAPDRQAWTDTILHYVDNQDERMVIEKNAHDFVVNHYYYRNYQQVIRRCIGG